MRFLPRVDDVLRGRPWTVEQGRAGPRLAQLGAMLAVFGAVYGAVMGSYASLWGTLRWQPLVSATKMPLLLIGTFALSLPSFFVVNTLVGLRADFARAVRALLATQAATTIILASLAPVTLLWYFTADNYSAAVLFNAVMFGGSAVAGQLLLRRYYQPLIAANARHRVMLWMWLVIYAFVGIQMGWVLRPFVGDPDLPTRLFRDTVWGNAYLELAEMFWGLLSG